jgi:mannitol-1-/sugar-/sorbitol-6-phosphatase
MTIRRRLEAAIFLFDMDGTLIDATATIEHIWTLWASRHGVDVAELLAASRGQRIVDTVREFAPTGVDEESEVQWLAQAGQSTTMGLIAIPGAIDLLSALPPSRWAIVTSAEPDLATRWLSAAGLPLPSVLISGRDVAQGKPDPAGYLLAARALDHPMTDAVVFEDSAVGVTAGHTAGARVVGVANAALAGDPRLEYWLPDFGAVRVQVNDGRSLTLLTHP